MAEYPHEREWEISPEEREQQRKHEREHQQAADNMSEYERKYHRRQRQRQSRAMTEGGRRREYEYEQERETSSLISRILHAIFAPIIGFIAIALVSLTWSGLLFGGLMTYSALGNPITGWVVLFSALVWMGGFKVLRDILLRPSGAASTV